MKRIIALVSALLLLAGIASAGLTITERHTSTIGTRKLVTATIAFDSSYPTGGEALTPATLGLASIDLLIAETDDDGYFLQYDYSEGLLLAYGVQDSIHAALIGPLVEAANTTNLSGVTGVKVLVIGK